MGKSHFVCLTIAICLCWSSPPCLNLRIHCLSRGVHTTQLKRGTDNYGHIPSSDPIFRQFHVKVGGCTNPMPLIK